MTVSTDALGLVRPEFRFLSEIESAINAYESEISVTPSTLAILLHLGGVIQTIKDVVKGVEDVVSGKASASDAQAVLQDLAGLISGGVFKIPGMSDAQIQQIIADLSKI